MIGQGEVTMIPEVQFLMQAGGLGIAAYLVWWMTKKLNGKFDKLTAAVEKLSDNIERFTKG
jgi:hypothetical protein